MTKNNFVVLFFIGIILLIGIIAVYNHPAFTGFAVDFYNGENIQKLKLTSVCSPEPEIYRAWRVWNKNDIDLEFDWDVYGTNQNGSGIALADSYSYFNTTAIEEVNTVRIFVNGSQHSVKASSGEKCIIPCIENWTCGNWSECINLTQIRECSDANICDTTLNILLLSQECVEENTEQNQITNQTTLNQTQNNQTGQNQTTNNETQNNQFQTNQTDLNQTQNNQTNNHEEQTPAPGGGGGGGGGGEGGVMLSSKEAETTQEIVKEEIKEQEINKGIEEELPEQQRSFVALVGNVIRLPFDKLENFFRTEGIDFRIGYTFLIVIISLIITVLFFSYFKLKKQKNA